MKQLLLLILCLLATFKAISQEDTNKYVILTESQAKQVMKDLIHMDALEATNTELDKRIDNLLKKEIIYNNTILLKDSIISNQEKIIALKDKMLNAKKPLEIHSYIGVRTYNLDIADPIFYFRAQLEIKKINVGAMANFQPAVPDSSTDGFSYSIFVEYKIF